MIGGVSLSGGSPVWAGGGGVGGVAPAFAFNVGCLPVDGPLAGVRCGGAIGGGDLRNQLEKSWAWAGSTASTVHIPRMPTTRMHRRNMRRLPATGRSFAWTIHRPRSIAIIVSRETTQLGQDASWAE